MAYSKLFWYYWGSIKNRSGGEEGPGLGEPSLGGLYPSLGSEPEMGDFDEGGLDLENFESDNNDSLKGEANGSGDSDFEASSVNEAPSGLSRELS